MPKRDAALLVRAGIARQLLARPRPWRLLALLALAVGCENGVTIRATVEIPAEVAAGFSAEQPGAVFVMGNIPKTGPIAARIGFVCGPGQTPIELPFFHDGFGCAKRGTLVAWIQPHRGPLPVVCGARQDPAGSSISLPDAVARDEQVIFANHEPGWGCTTDEATVRFVLKPVAPAPSSPEPRP
jgi:hypothetical protein